ncbi:MAG: glycosyltransferase family 2 protein, partial [Bacteroidales bacterium]
MKDVAILLAVFNHLDATRTCLESLEKVCADTGYTHAKYQVVLIDDGSTDGTSEWVRQHHPTVHLLRGDGNLWWSGGINRGAEYAMETLGADYLLLWNNDVQPDPGYFRALDALIPESGDRVILGSKVLWVGTDETVWSYGGIFDSRTGKKYLIGYGEKDSSAFSEPREVDWLPGMGTLVPVPVVRQIGVWDEKNFPQYHGDSDYTFRARTAGFPVRVYPQLRMWNDKSTSGLKHGGTLRGLVRSLTDIRSNSNVRKNLLFYRRHATSVRAYGAVLHYY